MVAWYDLQCIGNDEARPRLVAQIMEDHNVRGWIIAAFSRGMAGQRGQAVFECVEGQFSFARRRRSSQMMADDGHAAPGRKCKKNV